ncbi:pseudaminic acid synthase [Pseudoalteromonas fenneropenaei]|uniref:Pseudaminic acid synthase n=1 Tax=Pseudoalteromonas fenneropenaei TaxID=1737459 RepID=A0ABV7CGW5_9GAMM
MSNAFSINGRVIGPQQAPYIIAEISANHNGSIETALNTISMAKKMGADAIKIQTYTADTMTIDAPQADFQIAVGPWQGYNLHQLYQQAHTPFEWHAELFAHAKREGITLFSTPFDETAVDLLESLDTPAYKIASFELTDLPLIAYVAKTGKPLIMSTGMANAMEIAEALDCAKSHGAQHIVLLHCVSSYPAVTERANLRAIKTLAQQFNVLTGLSDHTLSHTAAIAATTLGATVIEKHFTLDRSIPGPDAAFSIEPEELNMLVQTTSSTWQAIGTGELGTTKDEEQNLQFRRSIYVVKDIKKGEKFSKENIRRIRPGFGLAPKHYEQILTLTANKDLIRGSALSWDDVKN